MQIEAIRVTRRGCRALVVVALALLFPIDVEGQTVAPVRLEQFVSGVDLKTRERLDVTDIVVAGKSVKHLFQHIPPKKLSAREYYRNTRHTIQVLIKGPQELQELKIALATVPESRIVVLLEDRHKTWLRYVLPNSRFERKASIAYEVTPCDAITRIVVEKVDLLVRQEAQKSGQTDKRISLNEVFDKLLRGEIEKYMRSLDPIRAGDVCFKTFEMLHWLNGEDASGFDFGDYGLNSGLRGLLIPAVTGLLSVKSQWSQSRLNVRVVGRTDSVPFGDLVNQDRRELRRDRTGIQDWTKIGSPLHIRYAGCTTDRMDSAQPVYSTLDVGDRSVPWLELREGEHIENNCGLGAARSYVAMVFLINSLGLDSVDYSYSTGGVARPRPTAAVPDARERKVDIEFVLKAARAKG